MAGRLTPLVKHLKLSNLKLVKKVIDDELHEIIVTYWSKSLSGDWLNGNVPEDIVLLKEKLLLYIEYLDSLIYFTESIGQLRELVNRIPDELEATLRKHEIHSPDTSNDEKVYLLHKRNDYKEHGGSTLQ